MRAALALTVILAGCATSRPASSPTALVVRYPNGRTVSRGTFVNGEVALMRGQRLIVSTTVDPATHATWALVDSAGSVLAAEPLSGRAQTECCLEFTGEDVRTVSSCTPTTQAWRFVAARPGRGRVRIASRLLEGDPETAGTFDVSVVVQ